MRAKKSLGQHFLTSEKALRLMVESAPVRPGDMVIEIGPGKGALTRKLLEAGAKVIAIELDQDMIDILTDEFAHHIQDRQLVLITGDVRALDPDTIEALTQNTPYRVVANIPYYITGEILRQFLTMVPQPISLTVLIQKEVAERIARSEKESVLSLSVKLFGTPRYVATVPAGSFSPPPSVDSAILHVEHMHRDTVDTIGEDLYFAVVKAAFSSRRKMLIKNLSTLFTKEATTEALRSISLPETVRAEDIPSHLWPTLITALSSNTKQ